MSDILAIYGALILYFWCTIIGFNAWLGFGFYSIAASVFIISTECFSSVSIEIPSFQSSDSFTLTQSVVIGHLFRGCVWNVPPYLNLEP